MLISTARLPLRSADQDPRFPVTHWTMVQRAGEGSQADLEALCRQYWYPLYAYVRRGGHGPEDAEDLTQWFIAKLIEKRWVEEARGEACTFRSFLLIRLKRFLKDERAKAEAQKRGGGALHLPLDLEMVERRYASEPEGTQLSPDALFDRAWATSILDRVSTQLRQEFADSGKEAEFDTLQSCLAWNENTKTYREIAQEIGRGEGWVKVAVNRMRKRFRKLLENEIARTVPAGTLEDEIQTLTHALR